MADKRRVLVTGGGRGLGTAIVRAVAAAGHAIAELDARGGHQGRHALLAGQVDECTVFQQEIDERREGLIAVLSSTGTAAARAETQRCWSSSASRYSPEVRIPARLVIT